MKKLLFLFLILSLSSPLWSEVVLDRARGKVEVMIPGEFSWSPAEAGTVLPADCKISTGFNSTATLLVNGETRVSLKALTRLNVEEATQQSSGQQNTSLFMGSGRIRADVKRTQGSIHDFKVRTPVATAAVRGTSFKLSSGTLDVTEGTVRFTVGSSSFSFKRGQGSKIRIINGRAGLLSPTETTLADRRVITVAGVDEGSDVTGSGNSSTGRSGFATIELR